MTTITLNQTIAGLTPDIQKELADYAVSGKYSNVRGRDQAKARLIGYLHACLIHAAIAQGFPSHVEAYRRYTIERGYWDE